MVCQLTDGYVSDFLVKAIRVGGVSGDQLCQFRLALEPYMAEMVARKKGIKPELVSLMEENIEEANAYIKRAGSRGIWIWTFMFYLLGQRRIRCSLSFSRH